MASVEVISGDGGRVLGIAVGVGGGVGDQR